jgi:hypothetical protein
LFWPAGWWIRETLTVAMQPDDFGAEQDGFGEQFSIRRQRNVQTRTHQIGFKARRERRVAITAAR